jgi:hypothetical protein
MSDDEELNRREAGTVGDFLDGMVVGDRKMVRAPDGTLWHVTMTHNGPWPTPEDPPAEGEPE